MTTLIPTSCRCEKYPFPHYHEGEGKFERIKPSKFEDCRDDQGVKQEIEQRLLDL